MQEIKFGTDGWRAVISREFTFKNVRIVSQAIADYYLEQAAGAKLAFAVGYDTRFLSGAYAQLVSEVLSKNGIEVVLSDSPTPTPTLSFAVEKRHLSAGIMITASHNPAEYNGVKIKTSTGGAAGTDITKGVEAKLKADYSEPQGRKEASVNKEDLLADYIKFMRSYLDLAVFKKAKLRILVDAMHGSGNSLMAKILKGTGIKLEFTRADVNPSFEGLRPEPVVENLAATLAKMKKEKFDICLILDGDADRIAAIGKGGEFIHPQKILGLLALHLAEDRKMSGGLVKTIAGSTMMDHIAEKLNRKLYETPVGFKYISDLMVKQDILVGGEEAGGMGLKNYIPERDGTLAGLLLVEMMIQRKKPILKIVEEMEKRYGRYYYVRDDLRISKPITIKPEDFKPYKTLLDTSVVAFKDFDGVKLICSDESWLMFRGSGTEPIMRIYAEAKNLSKAKKLLALGREIILKYAV